MSPEDKKLLQAHLAILRGEVVSIELAIAVSDRLQRTRLRSYDGSYGYTATQWHRLRGTEEDKG